MDEKRKISSSWRREADEAARARGIESPWADRTNWDLQDMLEYEATADEAMATDQSLSVYDGDEYIEFVNAETEVYSNGAPITTFRYDNGEEHDWSVILESTLSGGKLIGDADVNERPTKIQWAVSTLMSVWACKHCRRVVTANEGDCHCQRYERPGKMRRYQVAFEHDSDAGDGLFAPGITQWCWLQLPDPGRMDATEYAQQWAETYCFAPVGRASMAACLLTWWGQGITHIRVQYTPQVTEGGKVRTQASDLSRVEKFQGWDECRANFRLVRAAARARRAARSDEYVPEKHSTAVDPGDIEDLSL